MIIHLNTCKSSFSLAAKNRKIGVVMQSLLTYAISQKKILLSRVIKLNKLFHTSIKQVSANDNLGVFTIHSLHAY